MINFIIVYLMAARARMSANRENREVGQGLVESALILLMIVAVAAGIWYFLGDDITKLYNEAVCNITGAMTSNQCVAPTPTPTPVP